MKKVIAFLSTLILCSTSILVISACDQENQTIKVEFELISKIEIKKTYNDKFGIRFYKENTIKKGIIPNDFWYLTADGKYLAEFNNITNETKQNINNILRIKDTDYYPNFTLLNGWDLKNINFTYKKNNNQKQLTNFNGRLIADISVLLKSTTVSIKEDINQKWISNPNSNPEFTKDWWNFVKTNQKFKNKINEIFIKEVKEQIDLNITNLDYDLSVWRAPSNVRTDISNNITSFVISIDIKGKNQLRNSYNYEVIIYNN